MSEAYQERECRITDAVNAYCEGFYSNAAQAATAFQVEARTAVQALDPGLHGYQLTGGLTQLLSR